MKIRLDHVGIGEVLRSEEVAQEVHQIAAARAESVRAHNKVQEHAPGAVEVEDYTTDRAASAVVILHASGLGLQAKYGVLTRGE